MYLWSMRGKLSHRFFQCQLVIPQFQNLKIIWTEGKNLAFPDILSRNVKNKDPDRYQLKYQKILASTIKTAIKKILHRA